MDSGDYDDEEEYEQGGVQSLPMQHGKYSKEKHRRIRGQQGHIFVLNQQYLSQLKATFLQWSTVYVRMLVNLVLA